MSEDLKEFDGDNLLFFLPIERMDKGRIVGFEESCEVIDFELSSDNLSHKHVSQRYMEDHARALMAPRKRARR